MADPDDTGFAAEIKSYKEGDQWWSFFQMEDVTGQLYGPFATEEDAIATAAENLEIYVTEYVETLLGLGITGENT